MHDDEGKLYTNYEMCSNQALLYCSLCRDQTPTHNTHTTLTHNTHNRHISHIHTLTTHNIHVQYMYLQHVGTHSRQARLWSKARTEIYMGDHNAA